MPNAVAPATFVSGRSKVRSRVATANTLRLKNNLFEKKKTILRFRLRVVADNIGNYAYGFDVKLVIFCSTGWGFGGAGRI